MVSKASLIFIPIILEGRSRTKVADAYGVFRGWVAKLISRYLARSGLVWSRRDCVEETPEGMVVGRLTEDPVDRLTPARGS
jgi:hypothetical protein